MFGSAHARPLPPATAWHFPALFVSTSQRQRHSSRSLEPKSDLQLKFCCLLCRSFSHFMSSATLRPDGLFSMDTDQKIKTWLFGGPSAKTEAFTREPVLVLLLPWIIRSYFNVCGFFLNGPTKPYKVKNRAFSVGKMPDTIGDMCSAGVSSIVHIVDGAFVNWHLFWKVPQYLLSDLIHHWFSFTIKQSYAIVIILE